MPNAPLDYIVVRDIRRRRTFPSFSFLYAQLFCSVLVLSQHRRCINTHRLPRIGSSDHRSISGPLFYLSRVRFLFSFLLSVRSAPKRCRPLSTRSRMFPLFFQRTKTLSRSFSQSRIPSGGRTSNARLPASSLRSFARPSHRALRRFYLAYPSLSNSQVDRTSAIQGYLKLNSNPAGAIVIAEQVCVECRRNVFMSEPIVLGNIRRVYSHLTSIHIWDPPLG